MLGYQLDPIAALMAPAFLGPPMHQGGGPPMFLGPPIHQGGQIFLGPPAHPGPQYLGPPLKQTGFYPRPKAAARALLKQMGGT